MKHTNALLTIAVASALAASCRKADTSVLPAAEAAPSVENLVKKVDTDRPFSGSMTLQVDNAVPLACDCSVGAPGDTYVGAGNLTHFGLTTINLRSCMSPDMLNGAPAIHVSSVAAFMVASNGDTIFTSTPAYTVPFVPGTAITSTIAINFEGGTGRFANANGGFTGTMTVAPDLQSAVLGNINGTISY